MNFEWKYGNQENLDCFLIRKKVFIDEQGFSQDNEFDETDAVSHHLCVYDNNGEPIGAARLFIDEHENSCSEHSCTENNNDSPYAEKHYTYHCGRICVLKKARGTGLGAEIMHELEKKAVSLCAKSLILSAQVRVKQFYAKHGYVETGEEYLDEFCPHILMRKSIK